MVGVVLAELSEEIVARKSIRRFRFLPFQLNLVGIASVFKVDVGRGIAGTSRGARLIGIEAVFAAVVEVTHHIAVTTHRNVFVNEGSGFGDEAMEEAVAVDRVAVAFNAADAVPRNIDVVGVFFIDKGNHIARDAVANTIAATVVALVENALFKFVGRA